jgi:hypothetical protein
MGKHETGYARVDRDFYPTPSWVVGALGEHIELAGKHLWEPACGDGRMSEALKAAGASVYSTDITDRGYIGLDGVLDFVADWNPKIPRYDGIATNPPFGDRGKLAESFIEIGLQRIAGSGFLALLLPNDFDSAKTRRRFFAECHSFTGKITLTRRIRWFEPPPGAPKKSPKENSAWFIWKANDSRPPVIMYAPQRREVERAALDRAATKLIRAANRKAARRPKMVPSSPLPPAGWLPLADLRTCHARLSAQRKEASDHCGGRRQEFQ